MPEAHVKPCYMLETPKTQDATKEIIPVDEAMAEMGNQQATLDEIAWLAGIIDGEGYIGIQLENIRKHFVVRRATVGLQISNTDEEIIIKASNIMRKIGVNPYLKVDSSALKKTTKKPVYVISIHRMAVVSRALNPVLPYLTGNKKLRAELIMEFCESRLKNFIKGSHTANFYTDRELQIIDICLPLQKRGASETIRKAELAQSRLSRLRIESRKNKKSGRLCSHKDSDDMVRPFVKA